MKTFLICLGVLALIALVMGMGLLNTLSGIITKLKELLTHISTLFQ